LVEFPFRFIVDIYGNVAIKHEGNMLLGARLELTLSGTSPWRAKGQATFDFLGEHHIPIDLTVGDELPPADLPISDPFTELIKAFTDKGNWNARLPDGAHMLVTLREIPVADEVLAHPTGDLTVCQKVVPLDLSISRFGNTAPASTGPFTVEQIQFGSQKVDKGDSVRDAFVPSQFLNLSDDEKLARPSFEPLPSGYTHVGTAQFSYSTHQQRASLGYETVVIDSLEERQKRSGKEYQYNADPKVVEALAGQGAAGLSAMRSTSSAAFAGPKGRKVHLKDPEYVVVDDETLAWQKSDCQPTYTEADILCRRKSAGGRRCHVAGRHEVEQV
jgi:hypothetical protein